MSKLVKVLYLEDDAVERRAFTRMVRDKGLPWEIRHAETLAAARAQLADASFDVIVADNHLPDGESLELFGDALNIPLVLVTGTLAEQLALRTMERGADDYLIKDMEHRHLAALPSAVEKALHRNAIHERERQLTRELRESERRLRATFDNAASGIVEVDDQGRLVAVNDRLCQMLGYARNELLGMSVHELTYAEDRPRCDDLNARLRDGRIPVFQCEERCLKRDGSPLWVQVARSAVRDPAGRYLYSIATLVDISARKAAEAQVRLHAAALEAAPNAISLSKTDREGTIVWVNAAFSRLTGYSAEESIGRSHHILSSGRQDQAFYRDLWETIKRGEVWRGELVNRRKDGTLYHEEMGVTPLYDEHGNITHFVAIKQDITARKQAAEVMHESELRHRVAAEELHAIMDATPAGVCVAHDRQCRRITGNALAHEILGVPLGGNISVTPNEQPVAARFRMCRDGIEVVGGEMPMQATARTGVAIRDVEFEVIRADGTRRTVLLNTAPLRSDDGTNCGSIGAFTDITERKRAEEALRQSELFYRQTLESIPGMVFTTRPDGYCDYQSRQWVEFTGVPMNQHLGDGWSRLLHPDDRPRAYAAWRDAVEGRADYDLEYRVRRHDGEYRWFKVRGRPIRDAQGRIIRWFGVCLDIEDLKRAEEALAVAKVSAEQASKAKDHFLAVLSHELRTPLTPVLTAVSMLQEDSRCDEGMRETLEMVRRNVELEARLIDDLLDITRIARGKVELEKKPVPLCTVIRLAVEVCQPDIEARRLHFGVDLGPDAPYVVHGDVARLQQVFWNLLKNAVKFTPHGGCVGVRCRLDSHTIVAEVNDSGVGIEPEDLSRIFNAFEQAERSTTRQFGGLGLGLAIAKAIVEMHGGSIEAHSQGKHKGASFRVRLPILAGAQPGAVGGERPAVAVRSPPTSGLRILLVEDHGDTARMMRQLLMMDGHDVKAAGDVATALALAKAGPFDLLLSDLGLPDGSGIDLMRELRRRGNNLPGIALSGYGREEDLRHSREAGFAVHLTKPTSPEKLAEAIAMVVQRASTAAG